MKMRNPKILLISILSVLYGLPSYSQNTKLKNQPDSVYIKTLNHYLNIRLFAAIKSNGFELVNKQNSTTLKYGTNENLSRGIAASYKGIGLGLSINDPILNNDEDKYGKSVGRDFQLNIYGRRSMVDLTLLSYTGFYLKNAGQHISSKPINYFPRQDITNFTFGTNYYYLLNNKRFSYRASFLHNEIQKKSAGSILLGGFFNLFLLQADSSLIPTALKNVMNEETNLISANLFTFGGGVGYAYTLVFLKHGYITASIISAAALQDFEGQNESGDYYGYDLKLTLQNQ